MGAECRICFQARLYRRPQYAIFDKSAGLSFSFDFCPATRETLYPGREECVGDHSVWVRGHALSFHRPISHLPYKEIPQQIAPSPCATSFLLSITFLQGGVSSFLEFECRDLVARHSNWIQRRADTSLKKLPVDQYIISERVDKKM